MATDEGGVTFEQAFEALRNAVEELESGTLPLEVAIARYEAGMQLVQQCNELLDKAELRIQRVGQELTAESSSPTRRTEPPANPRPE